MPNIKSAIKRVKVAEKKRIRNRAAKSTVRTYVKSAERTIAAAAPKPERTATSSRSEKVVVAPVSKPETTLQAVARALKELDSAASKGILHKNNAARRKSRLMKKYNQLQAGAQV